MQERKYRGISYETNTFVYGWLHQTKYESNKYFIRTFPNEDDDYVDVVVDKNTIGQEIGLTDKYDVKIFEGDIVRRRKVNVDKYLEDRTLEYNESVGVITWDEERLKYYIQNNSNEYEDMLKLFKYTYEVIGNIYENPELLEVK